MGESERVLSATELKSRWNTLAFTQQHFVCL